VRFAGPGHGGWVWVWGVRGVLRGWGGWHAQLPPLPSCGALIPRLAAALGRGSLKHAAPVPPPLFPGRFQFRRLDGTMSIKARQEAIDDFCGRPEVAVMLVSLRAASLGVNLVSANHVVLLGERRRRHRQRAAARGSGAARAPRCPAPPPLRSPPAACGRLAWFPAGSIPCWRGAPTQACCASLSPPPPLAADLWYNPTVEEQAIDRAHRIGQTRPVHVTRITIEGAPLAWAAGRGPPPPPPPHPGHTHVWGPALRSPAAVAGPPLPPPPLALASRLACPADALSLCLVPFPCWRRLH
jgi:hypothetical protein